MSPLERLAAELRAHPLGVDAGLAVLVWFVFAVMTAAVFWTEQPAALLVGTLLTARLAWRRRAPVPAAAAVTVVGLVELVLVDTFLPANVAALVVVHALAAYAPRPAGKVGLVLGLAGAVVAGLRYSAAGASDALLPAVGLIGIAVVAA